MVPYGAFTLTETETETEKMGLKPIDIGHCICLGQNEHLHTIPYNPFFISLGRGLCQCEQTLNGFWDTCTLAPVYNDFGYNEWEQFD